MKWKQKRIQKKKRIANSSIILYIKIIKRIRLRRIGGKMITDLEEALSISRGIMKMFGKPREVYISEFVLREMLGKGAEDLGLNRGRLVDPKVDGRTYEHRIKYKTGFYTCFSENRV